MKPVYWIILAVIVLCLAGYAASDYLGGSDAPDKLVTQALSASDMNKRVQAVVNLAMVKDQQASSAHLQRVAKETKDPEILAAALHALRRFIDTDTLPLFFDALDNPSTNVRQAAYDNLLNFYGGTLPADLTYKVGDSSDDRMRVINRLREIDKDSRLTPLEKIDKK